MCFVTFLASASLAAQELLLPAPTFPSSAVFNPLESVKPVLSPIELKHNFKHCSRHPATLESQKQWHASTLRTGG